MQEGAEVTAMRLIDANVLWERLDNEPWFDNADRDMIALPIVDAIPTVDAKIVVRCKDCIYWQDNNNGYPHKDCKWVCEETPDADDFCSYGERRTDE